MNKPMTDQTHTFAVISEVSTGAKFANGLMATLIIIYLGGNIVLDKADDLVLIVLLLWSMGCLFVSRIRGGLTQGERAVFLCVLLFIAVEAISYALNGATEDSFKQVGRHARLLFFMLFYPVFRYFSRAWMLWFGLLAGCLLSGLWALGDSTGLIPDKYHPEYGEHVHGSVDPTRFGGFSLMMAMMLACVLPWFKAKAPWLMVIGILAILLALNGLLQSGNRGAFLFIPAALFIVLCCYARTGVLGKKVLTATLVSAVVLLPIAVWLSPIPDRVADARLAYAMYQDSGQVAGQTEDGEAVDESIGARIELAKTSWAIFVRNPVIGVGPANYRPAARALADEGVVTPVSALFRHPHSQYLSSMSETGIVGLVCFIMLLAVPGYLYLRTLLVRESAIRDINVAIVGLIFVLGYAHFALTTNMFGRTTYLNSYIFILALTIGLLNGPESGPGSRAVSVSTGETQ